VTSFVPETHAKANGMSTLRRSEPLIVVAFQTDARANGGLESLVRIVEALHRDIVLITDREGDVAKRCRRIGATVEIWPFPTAAARVTLHPALRRVVRASALARFNENVRHLMRARGARLLLANDITAFWHAAPGARAAGGHVVFVNRDMFLAGRPYGAKWRLTRHVADAVVTLSDSMRRETEERIRPFVANGCPIERIYSIVEQVAAAPATRAEQNQVRQRFSLPLDCPLFVVVGSFCDKKNQLELIERGAVPLLDARPDAALVFVGDFEPQRSDYARRCQAAARQLPRAAQIHFVGYTREVGQLYRAATATCVASRYEGMARSMIESISEGTPVVSFDVTSAREILEGHGAGLVRPQGDYDGLAVDLAHLGSNEKRRLQLAHGGLVAARRLFSAHSAAEAYQELLTRLESGGQHAEAR
jgi:glycosyltransferase involved in cell wall biosynthesis